MIKKGVVFFIITFVCGWLLFFSLFEILHKFSLVSDQNLLFVSLAFAFVFALVCVIIAIILIKKERKTKIGNWLSGNFAKLLITYILIIICSRSIKSDLIWSINQMKEIISLEWTIFGISIAIFLIWYIAIIEYLEAKKPQKPKTALPIKTALFIQAKKDFYFDATLLMSNLWLLIINLIVLITATASAYVIINKATIFCQTLVLLTFYLCANRIFGLFTDILKLFTEKKNKLLKDSKVTNEEVNLQNEIIDNTEEMLITITTINKLKNINEDEKKKLVSKIFFDYAQVSESNFEKTMISEEKEQ